MGLYFFLEGQHVNCGYISLGLPTTTLTMLTRINWGLVCIVSCQWTMLVYTVTNGVHTVIKHTHTHTHTNIHTHKLLKLKFIQRQSY